MMDFPKELFLPQKVVYGKGSVLELAGESREFGLRGLIVHGASLQKNGWVEKIRNYRGPSFKIDFFCRGEGEPTLDEIVGVVQKAKSMDAQWIAGIGGGSVLDLAKAAAGLFHAKERPAFYQEGGELEEEGIPYIAVPTTAGSGSEATPNAVIINAEKKLKLSIRDKSFLARKVILDVALLQTLSPSVIGHSGMDALVQAYESYISKDATWFSEALALKAIDLVGEHLLPAFQSGAEEHLSSLLLGSFLCGVALASSRLGVIHGIAHPLGVLYDLPHGLICAVCFIPSIRINRQAMGHKYEMMSQVLGMDFIERIKDLLQKLKIESPFKGKKILEKNLILQETLRSGSTAANPKKISSRDVEFILSELF